jgi:hypothetical protein
MQGPLGLRRAAYPYHYLSELHTHVSHGMVSSELTIYQTRLPVQWSDCRIIASIHLNITSYNALICHLGSMAHYSQRLMRPVMVA